MNAFAFWNPSDQLLICAVNVVLQVTLVTVIALSVAAFARRSPAVRHWVLCASLLLLLASPVIALVMQSSGRSLLSVSLMHEAVASVSGATPLESAEMQPVERSSFPSPGGDFADTPNLARDSSADALDPFVADDLRRKDERHAEPVAAIEATSESALPEPTASPDEVSVAPLAPQQTATWMGESLRILMPPLLLVWLAGAVFFVVRLAIGCCRIGAILRSAKPNTNASLAKSFEQVGRALQVARMPELVLSHHVLGPFAAGVFRPRVVLPEQMFDRVTSDQMRDILVHEVAHIVRRDQVAVLLQNLAAAIFWLHPLAKALNRQLAQAREEICDNYVLAATDAPSYSRTLLTLAELVQTARPLPGTVGMFTSRWKLESRVAGLLDERRSRMVRLTTLGKTAVVALSLVMAMMAAFGTITLAVGQTETVSSEDKQSTIPPSGTPSSVAADANEWRAGNAKSALPGLIPAPADIPGLGRWQAMMMPVGGYIEAAVYSPDGKSIAFGDGLYVRIHDADSLDLQRVLVGHSGNVRAVAWSPDGKWIASGGDDATVRIWRSDGTPGPVLRDHLATVRSVAWHPQSRSLATAAMDGTIRLWGVDGKPGIVIEGHEAPINTVAWSPDGFVLAAGDENHTVRIWSAKGQPGPVLEGHHGAITRVRWSPDGKRLASSSVGLVPTEPGQRPIATVRLWKSDGTPGPTLNGHQAPIRAVAWSPDSSQLVTSSEDRQVLLWSVDGKIIRRFQQTGFDHGIVFSLDWNAKANRIVAGGRFSVRFFSTEGPVGSLKLIRPEGAKLMFLDWHPSRDQIAIAAQDSTIHLWSDGFKKELTIEGHDSFVGCVKWSPDGKQLASNDLSESVRLWDADGELLAELNGNRGIPRSMAWSPDGKRLAVTRRGAPVDLFNLDGDEVSFDIHDGGATGAAFSSDGKQLATSGLDANVRVTQIDDPTKKIPELALMQAFDGDVDSIAWSPDGQWIASGHNTSLRFWRPDGTPGPVVPAFESSVMRLDWSPDGKTVATGCWDTTVQLWKVDGSFLRRFPNHAAPCWGVSFSPDGKKLATCGWDGVARILDVETGEILAMAMYVPGPELPAEGEQNRRHVGIAFNQAGQVTYGDPDILEQQVVYLVEQPSGAFEVLKPSEFHSRVPGAILAASK